MCLNRGEGYEQLRRNNFQSKVKIMNNLRKVLSRGRDGMVV